MATLSEQAMVNRIAAQAEGIEGVAKAYKFAEIPDTITDLPALLLYPGQFESETSARFNRWRNEFTVIGSLFVASRQSRGGTIKFLENAAMPYGYLFRQKFQNEATINALMAGNNITRGFLVSGEYRVGGEELTFNGIEYIGWVFRWNFLEVE